MSGLDDMVGYRFVSPASIEKWGRIANHDPMGFLNEILGRPSNERPFLILVVGYPTEHATVPVIGKKPLGEIVTFV